MQFDWVVFDADDTLFKFDAFAGLTQLMAEFGEPFSHGDFKLYQQTNLPLWQAYQAGSISASTLQCQRFEGLALRLGVSAASLNDRFIAIMAQICELLPGAKSLLVGLAQRANLAIITNGFTAMQHTRLHHHGLTHLFDHVIISEQVGAAKPDAAIFQHALRQFDVQDPKRVLMVGDNLETDVLGAQRLGMQTCWLNHTGKPFSHTEVAEPDYQVASLDELAHLLLR